MKMKLILSFLVLSLGLSACLPDGGDDDNVEQDSYMPGAGYEYVLLPFGLNG